MPLRLNINIKAPDVMPLLGYVGKKFEKRIFANIQDILKQKNRKFSWALQLILSLKFFKKILPTNSTKIVVHIV